MHFLIATAQVGTCHSMHPSILPHPKGCAVESADAAHHALSAVQQHATCATVSNNSNHSHVIVFCMSTSATSHYICHCTITMQ